MSRQHIFCMAQQLERRRKSIIVWIVVWTLFGLLFASVFKSLSQAADKSMQIYQSLPPAVLKTVNISTDYLTLPEKFLSGQFLTVYLLAGSIFAVFMGVGVIGSKIHDKTIVNLLTKPLSRVSIYLMQAIVNVLSIIAMSIGVGVTMFFAFTFITGSAPSTQYFVSSFIGSATVFSTFALVGQFAGIVLQKTKAEGFGSALAVFSFFVNGLGGLAGVPEWLQKCSLYYYFNTIQLRDFYTLDTTRLIVLIGISILLIVAGMLTFRKKDLHI